MARKRLNKKVALIGSMVFVVLVLFLILLFLSLGRNPEPFIKDGDAAMLAGDYEQAERDYHKANGYAKTDSLRVDVLFKLAGLYIKTDKWRDVLGCWNSIIAIDPSNVRARFGRLKYSYIVADSGLYRAWQEVQSQASELIEVAEEEPALLSEYTDRWDPFETKEADRERLGPYLYLLRGRATLEITNMGSVTDRDESLARAISDLNRVQELEPNNVSASQHLARAVVTKGDILASRGDLEARDEAAELAKELLEQAVEIADADPRPHISLLSVKLALARMSSAAPMEEQIQPLETEYLSLVEKFPSDAAAFSALARFYRLSFKNLDKAVEAAERAAELDRKNAVYALSAAELHYRTFSIHGREPEIHKAIEAAKNALTLPNAQDKPGPREWANRMNRISLCVFLAKCYIGHVIGPRPAKTEQQKQQWLTEAEQVVHEIEQLIGVGESPQVTMWRGMLELAKAEAGLVDVQLESTGYRRAKSNEIRAMRQSAVRKLYAAYEQLRTLRPSRPPWPRDVQFAHLSYTLAGVFKNTSEVGAVREFLEGSLSSGIIETKPQALLDYAELLFRLNSWTHALSNVNVFEEHFEINERSQTLRVKGLIGANQFDEAEKELAKRRLDDPNTIKLQLALVLARIGRVRRAIGQKQFKERSPLIPQEPETPEEETVEPEASVQLLTAELKGHWANLAELLEKLLPMEPNSVPAATVISVCNTYVAEGNTDKAKALVDRFLEHFPDDTPTLFYKQLLSEPDPGGISEQRRKEIEEQVMSNIADPVRRAIGLGRFYHTYGELDKAAAEFRKVFKVGRLQEAVVDKPASEQTQEMMDAQRLGASYLFEIALSAEDWTQAEQIADAARRRNLDDSEGQFFAARLAVAKEEYQNALTRLEECLKLNPVSSRAYMLRSNVNAALGDEISCGEDAQKAASLNPLDGTIARGLAFAFYRRNEKLGNNVTSDQIIETRDALLNAIRLNPGQWRPRLESLYAEYISDEKPADALAIRQQLQNVAPSAENALLLGDMAKRMALRETNTERKEAFFEIAASAFQDARDMDPNSRRALAAQAELFRLRGQSEKAVELLTESGDKELLWAHYFRDGRLDDARRVLEQSYQGESQNSSVLRGLLLIAERTADKEAAKRYSEELVHLHEKKLGAAAAEDSEKSIIEEQLLASHLLQVQTFLKVGLIKETENKLQSFKEKYPDEKRVLLFEAWLAMKQGRLDDALERTNRSLESNRDDATAWRLRGNINLLKGSYEQAIDDLKTSKAYVPDPATRLALARAYLGAGRQEDAITELKNMVDDPQAYVGARELLEQVYLQSGRKEQLKRFYDETMEKSPDDVLWYERAGALAIAQGEFDRAQQLYGQAWQKGGQAGMTDAAALDGYLQALVLGAGTPDKTAGSWDPRKLDKVFEVGRKCLDTDFAPIAYLRMAEAKLKLGDKPTAIQYCQKAVAKAFAMTNETFAFEILQRMDRLLGAEEVSSYCTQMLETDPDSLAANLAMFNLAKIDGRYNKAVGYIDKCLEVAGPAHPRTVSYALMKTQVLQSAYHKTSDNNYLERAIAEYESLLQKMPNNTSILNNLAYMLARNNERLADAIKYAKRANEMRPNNPALLDTYAYVLYKNDRISEAVEFFQAALQQYEMNKISVPAEVYENLGVTKEKLGARSEAIAAYERALQTGAETLSEPARQRINEAIERLSRQGGTESLEP